MNGIHRDVQDLREQVRETCRDVDQVRQEVKLLREETESVSRQASELRDSLREVKHELQNLHYQYQGNNNNPNDGYSDEYDYGRDGADDRDEDLHTSQSRGDGTEPVLEPLDELVNGCAPSSADGSGHPSGGNGDSLSQSEEAAKAPEPESKIDPKDPNTLKSTNDYHFDGFCADIG